MASDNNKAIKELLEIIKSKVGRIEARQGVDSIKVNSMKDQLSVMNEKLDNLQQDVDVLKSDMVVVKKDLKELNKKADTILDVADGVDEDLQNQKKRLTRIERIPVIAHALNK